MKESFQVTIGGKRYRVYLDPGIARERAYDGRWLYASVHFDRRAIRLSPKVYKRSNRLAADVLIHETLHALDPTMSEQRVTRWAKTIARVLATSGLLNGDT